MSGQEAVSGDNPLTNAPLTNQDVNNSDDDMVIYKVSQKRNQRNLVDLHSLNIKYCNSFGTTVSQPRPQYFKPCHQAR